MYEDNYPDDNYMGHDQESGMTEGMYVGESGMGAYDPFATYQQVPVTYAFYEGLQESRF